MMSERTICELVRDSQAGKFSLVWCIWWYMQNRSWVILSSKS